MPGGPASSILTARPRPERARSLPASGLRTASVRCCASIGSIRFFMLSSRTLTAPTKLFWKLLVMTGCLILSSNVKGWNIAENFIGEKNLAGDPWEFGYAVAASRPLSLAASATNCAFCRENFALGAELYGGLGDRYSFGFSNTSHYLAPTVAFKMPNGPTLSFSPAAGLNHNSNGVLLRFGASYEIPQLF